MKTPQHLEPLRDPPERTFGKLTWNGEGKWTVEADPHVQELAKRLFPGYSRGKGALTIPNAKRAIENIHWLMLRFPLEISDPKVYEKGLAGAIDMHHHRQKALHGLDPATPPPNFKGVLYPYQAEDVAKMISAEKILNANQTGLGKTVEGLAAITTAEAYPALIVTPPNVQDQWMEMMEEFLCIQPKGELPLNGDGFVPANRMCFRMEGTTSRELPEFPLYLIHYGLLRYWKDRIIERGIRAIVFDEVQELRRTESKKYWAALGLTQGVEFVWGMSATPVYNYGDEIHSVMNAIEHNSLGDQMSFKREWCGGSWDSRVVDHPDKLGNYLQEESLMIRRRKKDKDVAQQLPPKRRSIITVDHDEDMYRHLMARAISLSKDYDGLSWKDRGKAVREIATGARAAAGASKAPYAAAWIKTLVSTGERPLIFAHHHVVHDAIKEACVDLRIVALTGKETRREKAKARRSFMEGEADIALLALRSSAGFDGFQKRGTCAVFAELDWSPAIHGQCEDRLHRPGLEGITALPIYYLVARSSYDSKVMDVLGLKAAQATGVMGDPIDDWEDNRSDSETATVRHLQDLIKRLKETE